MRRGIELFKANLASKEQQIHSLETIIGKELDPIFKVFLKMLKIGEGTLHNAKKSDDGDLVDITFVEFLDKSDATTYRLSHFHSPQKLVDIWHDVVIDDPYFVRHKVLPIAVTAIDQNRIYVSLSSEDYFSIWIDDTENTLEEYPIKRLADDVCAFIQLLVESDVRDEDFRGKRIFNNWHEDFWRMEE